MALVSGTRTKSPECLNNPALDVVKAYYKEKVLKKLYEVQKVSPVEKF